MIRFRPDNEIEDVFDLSFFNLKAFMGVTKKRFRDEIVWESSVKQAPRKSNNRKSTLVESKVY